jgi:hypothetical protein
MFRTLGKAVIFFIISASIAYGQDSSLHPSIKFDISGIHIKHWPDYQPILNSNVIPAAEPAPYGQGPYLKYYANATDGPLYHSAESIDLFADASALNSIHLLGDIIAEHRGASYGVYSTNNIIVYPRVTFKFDTAISVSDEHFDFHLTVGSFTNLQVMQGLLMYNVDGQGLVGHLGWHSLYLNYSHMGDMLEGIGLNTNDAQDYTVSLNDIPISRKLTATIESGFFIYDNFWHKQIWNFLELDTSIGGQERISYVPYSKDAPFIMSNTGWSIAGRLSNDSLKLFSEYRYRNPLQPTGTLQSKSALLIGASDNFKSERFSLQARAEYRFYGALFNDNYINDNVQYNSGTYAATIGPYLYPLTQFLRPFSQWAVFTEYQGRDVAGYTVQLDSKYFFFEQFALNAMLDLNLIHATELPASIYPFYDIGFSWEPIRNTGLFASVTNREMNLNEHYPTLFLLKYPSAQLELRYNFDKSRY